MANIPCKDCSSAADENDFISMMVFSDTKTATPMKVAAYTDHPQCLEELLRTWNGNPITSLELADALYLAVLFGRIECTEMLIKAGADVNGKIERYCLEDYLCFEEYRVPIDRRKHAECLKLIINAGLKLETEEIEMAWPLTMAVDYGHTDCVKALIEAGADINGHSEGSWSALKTAVVNEWAYMVNFLLRKGAQVNYGGEQGTPLFAAAAHKAPLPMQMLIEAGTDLNMLDTEGRTALMKLFVWTRLNYHYVTKPGAYACITVLLEAGSDINTPDMYGNTALMLAGKQPIDTVVHMKDLKIVSQVVRLLLQYGAFINKFNNTGCNALDHFMLSCGAKFIEPAMILLAAGETMGVATYHEIKDQEENLPECLLIDNRMLPLKDICRKAVRKHLLSIDRHSHLYKRIPELGLLPPLLTEYLLFDMSLDTPASSGVY